MHRPWHQNVRCEWDGSRPLPYAKNDFDLNGLALMDGRSIAPPECIVRRFLTQSQCCCVSSVSSLLSPRGDFSRIDFRM
jgi:hypothetical protein